MATAKFNERSWLWVAGSIVAMVWLGLSGMGIAHAQAPDDKWSADYYKQMADASSSATIPPGQTSPPRRRLMRPAGDWSIQK